MNRSVRQAPPERTAGGVTTLKAERGSPSPLSQAKRRCKRGTRGQVRAQDAVADVRACNAQSEAYANLPGRRWLRWTSS
jgi:hypothetical protein